MILKLKIPLLFKEKKVVFAIGGLIFLLFSLSLSLAFFSSKRTIGRKAAGGVVRLFIEPATAVLRRGESSTFSVKMVSPVNKLAGTAQVRIQFDPATIAISGVSCAEVLPDSGFETVEGNIINLLCFKQTGYNLVANTPVTLGTFQVTARAGGGSSAGSLSFAYTALVEKTTYQDLISQAIGANYTIINPTPSPTATPPARPTPSPTTRPSSTPTVISCQTSPVLDQAQEIVAVAQRIDSSGQRISFSPKRRGRLDGVDFCFSGTGQGVVSVLDSRGKLLTDQKYFSIAASGSCRWLKFDFGVEPMVEPGINYLIWVRASSGTVSAHRSSLSAIPDWNIAWGKRIYIKPCGGGGIVVSPTRPPATPTIGNHLPVVQTASLPLVNRSTSYWARINAYDLNVSDTLTMTMSNLPSGLTVRNCTSYVQNSIKWIGCDVGGTSTAVARVYPVRVQVSDNKGGVTVKTINLTVR